MRKHLKRILYPFLNKWFQWYLSKPRIFEFKGLKLMIYPGVFHPGWLISTRLLIKYLEPYDLNGKTLLELGAGSGLISLLSARKGARVTASDINATAVAGLFENAAANDIPTIEILQSDLFDHISHRVYDYIVINPPYYPKDPANDREMAFYCGSGYEYFKKLALQLPLYLGSHTRCIMILSEDCQIETIVNLLSSGGLQIREVHRERKWWEWNFIFSIENSRKAEH